MFNLLKNSRGKILNLFFKDPGREYYLREIAKILGKEPSYFQKALNNLVKDDILKDERKGNLRFFKLNKHHPLYEDLKKIISKTLGIEGKLKKMVDEMNSVECAFIFGSIAKGGEVSESDIDLMLIGHDINQDRLIEEVTKLEHELNREINYHVFDKPGIIKKLKDNDDFIIKIFTETSIILKGSLNEYTKSTKFNKR